MEVSEIWGAGTLTLSHAITWSYLVAYAYASFGLAVPVPCFPGIILGFCLALGSRSAARG
jgi:hypothetical protein